MYNSGMSESTTSQDSLDGRKASAEAQKELRRRCIVYFRKGVKRAEIARKLGLSRQWVTKTENSYLRERCSQTREHPRFLFT